MSAALTFDMEKDALETRSINSSLGNLAALPAEVRQQIFAAAFNETYTIVGVRGPKMPYHPLFEVSKAVRAEAREIVFEGAIIKIGSLKELRDLVATTIKTQYRLPNGEVTVRPRNLCIQPHFMTNIWKFWDLKAATDKFLGEWAKHLLEFPLAEGSTLVFDLSLIPLGDLDPEYISVGHFLQRVCTRIWVKYKSGVKIDYILPAEYTQKIFNGVLPQQRPPLQ